MKLLEIWKRKIIKTMLSLVNKEINLKNPEALKLKSAMLHFLVDGKLIRGLFAVASNYFVNKGSLSKDIFKIASAIEFIHTYTLIHDDLPAMDNSTTRRNKPTVHKKFDEATAILAGDALLTLGLKTIGVIDQKVLEVIGSAVGAGGVILGQMFDISDRKDRSVKEIHLYKTGKLIEASILAGALISKNAGKKQLKKLSSDGRKIGMIFQIVDDVIEIEKGTKFTGKSEVDLKNKKLTYPSVYGLKKSKEYAIKEFKKIKMHGKHSTPLMEIYKMIIDRIN